MQNNIDTIVDFEKLRQTNDLCHKWADRFGISSNKFMKFIINAKSNYEFYKNKLAIKYRSQFSKDHKKMFYAFEVENALIQQYYNCALKIIGILHIKEEDFDEYLSIALITARHAVWQYKTHKSRASFFTFLYNGIFMRLSGKKSKDYKNLKNRKFYIYNETDMVKEDETNQLLHFSKSKQEQVFYQDEIDMCKMKLQYIFDHVLQDESDKILLGLYIKRHEEHSKWCNKYREMFLKSDGKKLSRQAVHNKLKKMQEKLKFVFLKNKFDIDFSKQNKFAI